MTHQSRNNRRASPAVDMWSSVLMRHTPTAERPSENPLTHSFPPFVKIPQADGVGATTSMV